MGKYSKTMAEALKDVYMPEGNMDLMRKAASGSAQDIKMKDGKLKVDSFTASAIIQIYDKVNKANQRKMESMINSGRKADIMKLSNFAMSKINSEYVPEELQEGTWKAPETKIDQMALRKTLRKPIKAKDAEKVMSQHIGDDELYDEFYELEKDDPNQDVRPLIRNRMKELGIKEEIELDERIDPADVDDDATDDDIKSADKNIMMQMRKVQSLRGRYAVEFMDGKKVKVDPKIAMAVQDKYMKMRRPAEKEKFQSKVARSYKDMLSALKESLELKESKYLEIEFRDKRTAEKAYNYINNEIWAGGNPPYDDFNQEGDTLQIDHRGNSKDLLDDLKDLPRNMKFKVAVDEELDEARKEVRQLKDPKKEMMVKSKDSGVFVIDKKDFKKFERKGFFEVEGYNPYDKTKKNKKEGFASDAQRRAAFASGYKEKGKKKKESTLQRISQKIQERKNG